MKPTFEQFEKYRFITDLTCWELVKLILNDYNMYPKDYWERDFHKNFVEIFDPKVLDILLFLPFENDAHVGLYVGNGYFIQSIKGKVSIPRVSLYRATFEGYYRWQE